MEMYCIHSQYISIAMHPQRARMFKCIYCFYCNGINLVDRLVEQQADSAHADRSAEGCVCVQLRAQVCWKWQLVSWVVSVWPLVCGLKTKELRL